MDGEAEGAIQHYVSTEQVLGQTAPDDTMTRRARAHDHVCSQALPRRDRQVDAEGGPFTGLTLDGDTAAVGFYN